MKLLSVGIVLGIFIGFGLGSKTCQEETDQIIHKMANSCNEAMGYAEDQIDLLNEKLK